MHCSKEQNINWNKSVCNQDCDHIRVWLTILLCILQKGHTVTQHIYTTVTRSTGITSSFWTVTDCEPGLSSESIVMCPLCYNVDNYYSQSCERLTDAIKHSDITGTSELLIIHFILYGIVAQSTALFTCTHVHYTYIHMHTHTLHTCCSLSCTS